MAFIAPRVSRRERVRNPILAGVGDALQGIPAILQMMQFMEMRQGQEDRDQARFEQEEEERREAEIAAGLAGPLGERDLDAYLRAVDRLDLTPEEQRQVDLDFPTEQQWDIGAADAIAARLGDNLPFMDPEYLSQLAAEAGGRGPTIGLSDVLHGAPVPGDLSPDLVAGTTPEDMALTGLGATPSALPEASIDPTAESDWADILSGGGLERLTEQTELDPSMGPVELGDPRLGIGDHLAQLQGATKRRLEFMPPLEEARIAAATAASEAATEASQWERKQIEREYNNSQEMQRLEIDLANRGFDIQERQIVHSMNIAQLQFDAQQASLAVEADQSRRIYNLQVWQHQKQDQNIAMEREILAKELSGQLNPAERAIHDAQMITANLQNDMLRVQLDMATKEMNGILNPDQRKAMDLDLELKQLQLNKAKAEASGSLNPTQRIQFDTDIKYKEAQIRELDRRNISPFPGMSLGGQGDPTSPSVNLNDPDDPEQNVMSYRLSPDGPGLYTSTGGEDQEPRRGIDIAHEQLAPLIRDADELRGQFPEESEELLERLAAQVREADFEARASEGPVPERAEHLLESPHREDEVDPVSVARRQMGRLSGRQQRVSPKLAELESTIDQLASQLGVDKQALEALIRSSPKKRQADVAKYAPYEPGWSLTRMLTGQ